MRAIFRTTRGKAFLSWLATLLTAIPIVLLVILLIKPYMMSVYLIPTNSMAPTVIGRHVTGVCPACGADSFRSPPYPESFFKDELCICENYHECVLPDIDPKVDQGDRIVAIPFLNPQRWDLVVFQLPEDSATSYVKRLVGLPGETIEIRDGAVWADGQKLTPPAALSEIEYQTEVEGWNGTVWGSKETHAVLSEGEYYMLGDFQSRARDSRVWERGADGHPPFAVPSSHLQGVVTHIVWPPSRRRIFR